MTKIDLTINPHRAVVEFPWRVLCALLELPEDTQFIAATRRDDEMIGMVIEHDKLLPLEELAPLPLVKPAWSPPHEASFRGWVEVG